MPNSDSLPLQTASPTQQRILETTLSAITDFAYSFDLGGRFIFVNKPLLDLWGLTLEQAVGKNFFDLRYPDELAAKLQRQIQQVIRTRQRVVDETPYTSPSGADGFYQYIFSPVIGTDGRVEAVAGSTRDISDWKRLEAEHNRLTRTVDGERSKLAHIIEQSPAFIGVLRGPEHLFELANEQYYRVAGRRDIIGKTVRQAFPDIAGQGFYELLDQVYRTGKTFSGYELPIHLTYPDGMQDLRHMNLVYQALRDAEGLISGIFVHGVDVTDQVRSREQLRLREDRLRTSEERLAFALDAAELGTFYCPMPLGEIIWNAKCKEHFWLPADAVIDFDLFYSIIHPEDRERTRRAVEEAVYHHKTYDVEYRTVAPDGRVRWVRTKGRAYYDAAGAPLRFDGVTLDVSEQKRLADEREQLLAAERAARDEAENANRAKDKFLAVLSHELRTPLSPVAMTIPAMEMDPDLPYKFREDLAMVRRNIDLEVKLIDDLLDLSRVTSGKLRLHMQPVQVHDLLRHVIQSSVSDAAAKRLHLALELQAANDRLTADPARLQQVFWNLLRNAVKFTPEGGTITVRSSNDRGRLVVEIADNGVGIPADVLPRIFDAFEQGEARMTRQFGGLGLGLAIAKAVVEMHGGTIGVASGGRDQGAVFTVRLQHAAARTATSEKGMPAAPCDNSHARVLLVEDHPDTSRTLAKLLQMDGFEVKTAGSVAAALQLAAVHTFDIVVSDIGLPDASGYELMAQIKGQFGISGIALSGYGMEEDMRKSREAGFVEHVVKPVNVAQLQAIIRRVVGGTADGAADCGTKE